MYEVQRTTRQCTHPADIPRVLGNLRIVEHEVKHAATLVAEQESGSRKKTRISGTVSTLFILHFGLLAVVRMACSL